MSAPGVTLVKTFEYRGAQEEWANTYHMTLAPSDPAGWRTAVDGLIAQEKTLYTSDVVILRALCYTDTSLASVYTYDLASFGGTVPGTLVIGTGSRAPGDVAAWVRWDTGRRSTRGKTIYLRKYFHDVYVESGSSSDIVSPDWRTAAAAFGTAMLSALGGGFALAGPDGVQPPGPAGHSTYATTRTLERRGRRP
jgi:hypothetical protein